MKKISQRYKELLSKYSSSDEILELIELVVQDDFRVKEDYYDRNEKYPIQRDLLGKLKCDILTTRAVLSSNRLPK